jgi:hypothetical protein
MQVDFIISRTEFAIVEISGKGKDESFSGPNSASTVKSLQNLLFPYRLCDGSYAAGKHLLVVQHLVSSFP